MPPQRDPISVRTTRLNNLILGKGVGAIQKPLGATRRSIVPISTTSAAVAEAVCREGLLDAFCLLYNECDKETLKKRDRNIAEFVTKFRPIVEETRQLRVNADDFVIKALIGKGYFGNVHLVVERQTSDVYAMKKIKKSMVTTSQVERDIMSRRNSEWLTNLQYAFQDNDNLYLIMEYLPGGDLLSLMSRHGPFDEDLVRFYLAELTLALHTLHNMGFVHRDIKPENILIDRFGHIKLADFGNAAALDRDGHVLSLSPVGTPDYIAPELLQTISTYKLSKSMHDVSLIVSCDYWSMGIIGYELICEITPFHEDNVHETYSKILSHCEESRLKEIINFPSDLKISSNLKSLICSLVTNPTNRLSYEQIVKHPFFETMQWSTVRSQVPPIIPTIKSDDDISNFEDGIRHKARREQQTKKSLTSNMKSNDFSGKDLPFIGYSFVHMENDAISGDDSESSRNAKLQEKLRNLQTKLKSHETEILVLKQDLLRAQQALKKTDGKSQVVLEAKAEIKKLQQIIKEKTMELSTCKTQIKTLQSSAKIDEEMWSKKEATITDLLRLNRQKYEEAKIASEQRYEKQLAEKKQELASTTQKLEARELEFHAKSDECKHLTDKLDNYKEMLKQLKEQSNKADKNNEQQVNHLRDTYENKMTELRHKLRDSQDTHRRMTLELQDIRTELDESISSSKSTQEAKHASERSIEELLQRLNSEISANNELRAGKSLLETQLNNAKKETQEMQTECVRLERELQLAECRCNLAESSLASQTSPYETAPGSLTELHAIEDQLRADLAVAKEGECVQKTRADQLQELVNKLEHMLERFNEQSLSPMKSHGGSHHGNTAVGDMLERQNEKLEDKLAAVREQMIVERQAARTANLSLWKVEKQLEEALAEKKLLARRMELTEDRVKKAQNERDEAQRALKSSQDEFRQRDARIEELKGELAASKRDVLKEHRMWEKAEQERMKCKSEIIEHLANVHKLEQQATELRQKLQQTQLRCDGLGLEQKRLQRELQEKRERGVVVGEGSQALQAEIKQLTDNFQRLKYACSITDNQLTEVEAMLETEQQRNKKQQTQLEACHDKLRERNEQLSEVRKELAVQESGKRLAEQRAQVLSVELDELKQNLQQLQKKLIAQQGQLVEQTNALFGAQERTDQLETQSANCQTQNSEYERELFQLKEENARILSDLFHSRDEVCHLQQELQQLQEVQTGLHSEIDELQNTLQEKEQYFVQRDIKSMATLAQHKKLIDYLQLKVEDLSAKKKKTLADKIFGSSSNAKENISPNDVESSILYRALKEELRREQKHSKMLQEQLDQLNGTALLRSPSKSNGHSEDKKSRPASIAVVPRSPLKEKEQTQLKRAVSQVEVKSKSKSPQKQQQTQPTHHRFELALHESKLDKMSCLACEQLIIVGSPYWRCKECKEVAHRKCRSNVSESCGSKVTPTAPSIVDSCEELQALSSDTTESEKSSNDDYLGTLVYNGAVQQSGEAIEINCAYEIVEQKILLFGCNNGLFAYNVETQRLLHIAGIESVSYVSISTRLAKAIMVGASGEKLYQCDYRQLETRCQSAIPCQKPSLETSVIELPFANRTASEKWKLVQISNETENALDSVAIAATSSRIVILKYDLKLHKFKPVRALDTATPVTSIFYTRHSAIVSSDKFYEIDLDNYAAEEFIDLADKSLQHTIKCQPFVAVRISRQEFLLCFAECGVFVDEFGCRSRPYDLNWIYAPTGFVYREPFLYVSHYQHVQVMRLQRSYSKQLASGLNADSNDAPDMQRLYLPHYMPTLLTSSGDTNAYTLSIDQQSGVQQIYHLDVLQAFKHKLNVSMETISSVATSVTLGSIMTTDSV
ncbi:citron Rho-interacting kinase isoform X1 [Drosophila sulfurigaster albostrigata]|uniref:citron Rho-interacting kinase isoform X1 n=1 Tax=Drosophila sulfurigaster albostrigata TaxID=89887 RepID=UPI002D21C81F|nr:citron Rho-interacting kinase isoform X1 [Drosophila sulfurigaster albostrigata]